MRLLGEDSTAAEKQRSFRVLEGRKIRSDLFRFVNVILSFFLNKESFLKA